MQRCHWLLIMRAAACCGFLFALSGCGQDTPEPEPERSPKPVVSKSKSAKGKGALAKSASKKAGEPGKGQIAQAKPKNKDTDESGKEKPVDAAKKTKEQPADPHDRDLTLVPPTSAPAPTQPMDPPAPAETQPAAKQGEMKDSDVKGLAIRESFDKAGDASLPAGWAQWVTEGGSLGLSNAKALSAPNAVRISGGSHSVSRAWFKEPQPADVQVSAAVYLETLIPGQVIVRGKELDTNHATFYAAAISRGMEVKLERVTRGAVTAIGSMKSAKWFSEKWVRLTLRAEGKRLSVQVRRLDTNEYLDENGVWQAGVSWALRANDEQIAGPGLVGLGREASYSGNVLFDDFAAGKPGEDAAPAAVAAAPAPKITPVAAPAPTPAAPAAPAVAVGVTPLGRPDIPRHYPHIRIALLAYHGNPMTAFEDRLLRESVDLLVPDERMLDHIAKVAPKTPSMIYTNTSSLYLELLTDWLTYADQNNLPREAAFYHARAAKQFRGDSPSSLSVNRFWKVLTGNGGLTEHTSSAHLQKGRIPVDGALYLGWPDRFREINFQLISGAAGGWKAIVEYPTAVDATGKPTTWAPLKLVADTTNGLQQSGQVTFDPPADWKPAVMQGVYRLHYVRFRTMVAGTAPIANTILGRDYVEAKGTNGGVIPAFDHDADVNKDGYLDDAEYARRAPGKNARFVHESRMFTQNYGQMRFGTNPSGQGFAGWGVDYHRRFLAQQPLAAGLFMDNSDGQAPVEAGDVLEPVQNYAADYGLMLNAISKAIAPHWVLGNSAGSGRNAETVIKCNPAYFEEFALRPMAHDHMRFLDYAEVVERRIKLATPAPLAVLDSYPQNGKPTDARMQIGVLAYYYLLADPDSTFLCFFGGYEPGTAWNRHWTPAVAYDVGRPTGKWAVFGTGPDPVNPQLTYKVFQRTYDKALILFKPLSHGRGTNAKPTFGDDTATKHELEGTYRPLQADGTLGQPITSISLRNGEGAILIKAKP
jgi:hypothetical protein